jgi:factor associated with neutral sphingomyelinase activation
VLSIPAWIAQELIPEFYSGDGSFLLNAQQLPLGVRASGERVGDVRLPPWARSASHFVECCRAALESDFASGALHSWIELVFGHRQTGPSALEADNVFFHLTYEGALDLATVTDRCVQRGGLCGDPRRLAVTERPACCPTMRLRR